MAKPPAPAWRAVSRGRTTWHTVVEDLRVLETLMRVDIGGRENGEVGSRSCVGSHSSSTHSSSNSSSTPIFNNTKDEIIQSCRNF